MLWSRFRVSGVTRSARKTNTPPAVPSPLGPGDKLVSNQRLERALQILIVRRRALVKNHQIDGEPFHLPVLVSADQLADYFQIFGLVDSDQDDRQVARYIRAPEFRRAALAALQHVGRRPERRIRIEHAICETLKQMRLVGADAQVMQLHLRLGPRERDSAIRTRSRRDACRPGRAPRRGFARSSSRKRLGRWRRPGCGPGGED